jgi:hypothetical protein
MAELLLTQNELDAYLSSVDLSDPAINSVFNSIQLLTTNNYNDILYYLVNGRLTIQQLIQTPINNATARNLIAAAEQGGSTILARKKFYQNFLSKLPSFIAFGNDMKSVLSTYMYFLAYPSSNFVKTVEIDSTGLSTTKFNGIAPIKEKHNQILAYCKAQPQWSALTAYCSRYNLNSLLAIFDKELNTYEMISTADRKYLSLRASAKDSICGYAIRGLYGFSYRVYYAEYLDYIVSQMAAKYDQDAAKNGAVGLRYAQTLNNWDVLPRSSTASELIKNLGQLYMVFYKFPSIYGSSYFTQAEINSARAMLSIYIGDDALNPGFFGYVRAFLELFNSQLEAQLVP